MHYISKYKELCVRYSTLKDKVAKKQKHSASKWFHRHIIYKELTDGSDDAELTFRLILSFLLI